MKASPEVDASAPRAQRHLPFLKSTIDWPLVALGILMGASAAVILRNGNDIVPLFDEWFIIVPRDVITPDAYLEPHFGHLLALPVLIYQTVLAVGGFGALWLIRLLMVILFLLTAFGLFLIARRRTNSATAMVISGLLLVCFVPADVLLWRFQIGWQIAMCGLVWTVAILDGDSRRWDPAVALLVVASLASGGVGLLTLAVAAVMVASTKDRWRRSWIVLLPAILYFGWYLAYSPADDVPVQDGALSKLPGFAVGVLGKSLGAIFGLDQEIGKWLLVPFFAAVVYLIVTRRSVTPLLLASGTTLLFWLALVGVSRAGWTGPDRVTFVFPTVVLLLLIGIELVSGRSLPRGSFPVAILALLLIGVSNYPTLSEYGRLWSGFSSAMRGQLGVVRLVPPAERSTSLFGFIPYPGKVGDYFAAESSFGKVGLTPDELTRAGAIEAGSADALLVTVRSAGWKRVRRESVTCRLVSIGPGSVELPVRPQNPLFVTSDEPISLYLHRFWKGRLPAPTVVLPPSAFYRISAKRDANERVWSAEVSSTGSLRLCPR